MEEYKSCRKDFSRLGLMFVLGTLIIYGVQLLVLSAVGLLRPGWLTDINMSLVLTMGSMYLVGMPALIALVWWLPGKAPEKAIMKPGQFALALIMCYAILYVSNFVGTIITTIISFFKGSGVDNAIMDIASNANTGLVFLFMVICAPFYEEFIFRKLIVDKTLRYGEGVAVLLSGLMFGLFHGNLSQFAYAFTLGLFLAFLYVKTGRLRVTIAIHMCVNFIGGVVSVLVLKAIHYEEILEVPNDAGAISSLFMHNLGGWILYMFYLLMILGLTIAGIVLLIVFRRRFALRPGEIVLPKGKRFRIIFINVGMILYCLFWICMIIGQLFGVA